jgi:hypothetical protein
MPQSEADRHAKSKDPLRLPQSQSETLSARFLGLKLYGARFLVEQRFSATTKAWL